MDEQIWYAYGVNPGDALAATPLADAPQTYMFLERTPRAWLSEDERRAGITIDLLDRSCDLAAWERGRVFGAAGELRWEQRGAALQVVYTGPAARLPAFQLAAAPNLAGSTLRAAGYVLWGTRVAERDLERLGEAPGSQVFVELQVPRVLRYPVGPAARRVRLLTREWRSPAGALLYYRMCGLEELA